LAVNYADGKGIFAIVLDDNRETYPADPTLDRLPPAFRIQAPHYGESVRSSSVRMLSRVVERDRWERVTAKLGDLA